MWQKSLKRGIHPMVIRAVKEAYQMGEVDADGNNVFQLETGGPPIIGLICTQRRILTTKITVVTRTTSKTADGMNGQWLVGISTLTTVITEDGNQPSPSGILCCFVPMPNQMSLY